MDIIIYLLAGIGAFGVLCAVLALVATVTTCFLEDHAGKQYAKGRTDERYALEANADWFSEHPPTRNLLRRLAQSSLTDEVRKKWRQEVADYCGDSPVKEPSPQDVADSTRH